MSSNRAYFPAESLFACWRVTMGSAASFPETSFK
jgi:hypothetical protein